MFVKAIDTCEELAVNELLSYFSWPSGLAARLSAWLEEAEVGVVLGVVALLVGVVVLVEDVLELPAACEHERADEETQQSELAHGREL